MKTYRVAMCNKCVSTLKHPCQGLTIKAYYDSYIQHQQVFSNGNDMYTLIRVNEGILSNSVFRYIGDQTLTQL